MISPSLGTYLALCIDEILPTVAAATAAQWHHDGLISNQLKKSSRVGPLEPRQEGLRANPWLSLGTGAAQELDAALAV
ncbi:hypothetical protein B0J18DRAFT_433499 [Chaetomium sp. MPI-SDFR-AT-0129]|nr:hypothetical protein B0J18DRAFT_433499 [Chaetomium sp. MPI-SDFR-AT-0129]